MLLIYFPLDFKNLGQHRMAAKKKMFAEHYSQFLNMFPETFTIPFYDLAHKRIFAFMSEVQCIRMYTAT